MAGKARRAQGRGDPAEAKEPRDWLVFRWGVPSEGFEWIDGEHAPTISDPQDVDGGPWLVARSEKGQTYQPLHDERGALLFRRLADVTDRDTALVFANTYGQLGTTTPILRGAGATSGRILHGESLARWIREAAQLRAAFQIASAARARDVARLIKWIRVRTGRGVQFEHPVFGSLPFVPERDAAFQRLGPKLPGLGLLFAQRIINAKLEQREGIKPWAMPRVLAHRSAADAPALVLSITPIHLLAAAWIQLAKYVTGESATEYRRCESCGEWIPVGPNAGRRINRRYCGDTCYRRALRAREREGRE